MFLIKNTSILMKLKRSYLRIKCYHFYFDCKSVILNSSFQYHQSFNNIHRGKFAQNLLLNNPISSKNYRFSNSKNSYTNFCPSLRTFSALLKTHTFLNVKNQQSTRHCSSKAVVYSNNAVFNKILTFWKYVSESAAVEFTQNSLVWIHSNTGLSWWSTILLTAFTLRITLALPISIYMRHLFFRMEKIQNKMKDISERISLDTRLRASKFRWTQTHAKRVFINEVSQEYKKLVVKNNCHPFKIFMLPMLQIPPWIILSISVRNLCNMIPENNEAATIAYMELSNEGFGWITNLTVPDPYIILPILLMCQNVALCEIPYLSKLKSGEMKKLKKYVHYVFRTLAIGSGVIAIYVPSGLTLFWVSISSLALGQLCLIASPKFRKVIRMPETKFDPDVQLNNILPLKETKSVNYINSKIKKNKVLWK